MSTQTILLVDDDPDYLESSRIALENAGLPVRTASTETEALELVRIVKPAVAVLDVIMEEPDSGFRLARRIRDDEETRNVSIVLLTALNDVNREKGIAYRFSDRDRDEQWLPVDRILSKPVPPVRLVAVIRELMEERNAKDKL